jgi:hypothetical protein
MVVRPQCERKFGSARREDPEGPRPTENMKLGAGSMQGLVDPNILDYRLGSWMY